jgi:dCMP deaminase
MKLQQKIDDLHMDIAHRVAKESYCERKKVGAILVKDNRNIIAYGYNGTTSGADNCCEDVVDGLLITKDTVIHAEINVFDKLTGVDISGTTMYCTLTPCRPCAEVIAERGITKVIYSEPYRSTEGIDFLIDEGIEVEYHPRFML